MGLVCFLWHLCSHLVNIRLNALFTSVSAALVQFVRISSPVAARGQPRSPSDVFFSLSVFSVSLLPCVWKSHPSFSQEIPLRPRGKTDRECEGATEGHSRPHFLIYCSCFSFCILAFKKAQMFEIKYLAPT